MARQGRGSPEKRVDPTDGVAYTFEELAAFYAGKYKKKAIEGYWEECAPAKKAQPQAKADPKAKAKAKSKAKAKAEPNGKSHSDKPKPKAKSENKKPAGRAPASPEDVVGRVEACKVVPVVKITDVSTAVPLAKALKEGGVDVIEITFRTDCAAEAIRQVCKEVEGVCVGAGTVYTPAQAHEALDGGADFIVSPGFDAAVARACRARGALYLPGVITPTEVMMVSSRYKLQYLKFFPASNFGGAGTLKSYQAIFQNIKFMPTGGVTEQNISEYTSLKNVFAAGGSWFVSDALIAKGSSSGDWSEVTSAAAAASKAAKGS
mmetsp:Transcript_60218/g.127557  ORF Transcript_60218/g.127557 Transcript_60218/m.127557 type:complete len:319 (-) Transcript_60218:166-1122(-)